MVEMDETLELDDLMEELDVSTDEYCAIAFEEAQHMCATPELVFVQASRFMGFSTDEIDELLPLDVSYSDIVTNGTGSTLGEMRRWVLARAWDMHMNSNQDVMAAFQLAWQEAMAHDLDP